MIVAGAIGSKASRKADAIQIAISILSDSVLHLPASGIISYCVFYDITEKMETER